MNNIKKQKIIFQIYQYSSFFHLLDVHRSPGHLSLSPTDSEYSRLDRLNAKEIMTKQKNMMKVIRVAYIK